MHGERRIDERWLGDQQRAGITQNGSDSVTESLAGTYTFTITCTGGGQTASSSKTVVVNSNPPTFSLTAAAPTKQIYQPSGTNPVTLDLLWTTDVDNCFINYTTNSGESQAVILSGEGNSGAFSDYENVAGSVTYTMQCGSQTTSTTINWVANAVSAILTTTETTWPAQVSYLTHRGTHKHLPVPQLADRPEMDGRVLKDSLARNR